MIRAAINRLLMVAILGALAVLALFVAIEAGNRLAGGSGHVGPVDYASAWQSLQDWSPGDALRATIFAAVALGGLLLLLLEVLPGRRGPRTVEVARTDDGVVLLDVASASRRVRASLAERPWVASASPRLRLHERSATVSDRPRPTRPWEEAELAETQESVRSDLVRMGLEPAAVSIRPRPLGRRARTVR